MDAVLLDFAERPRVDDWSFRAALTRYAQPEPQRVSDVLELVRRIEFALRPHLKSPETVDPALADVVAVLDRLGDTLAAWAAAPTSDRPDAEVDATVAEVTRRLDDLGVPREERQPPPRGARSRG